VADVRDGWRFERNHGDFPLGPQRRLDLALERAVARRATRMTAVTRPIADDLRERLGARAATAVSNGFDLDELAPDGAPPPPGLIDPARHTLLYTGRLAYVKRSPGPLLAGLRALKRADPEAAARLEVLFAGPLQADERAEIEADDLRGSTRVLGALDRETTMRLQRATDTLLLITTGNPSETGQKLFEYLAADRPVLVVGDRTEAARIVRDAGAGTSVPLEDPEAIARGLAALVRDGAQTGDGAIARSFDYAALTDQLEAELEQAIRDHGDRP
jgi:glycosyltransferase involved in cell wall biosynthesis